MDWQTLLSGAGQVATGLAPIAGTGAQIYGQQNAAEAVEKANNAAIGTQKDYLANIQGVYSPYTTAGAGAAGALQRAQGTAPGQNGTPDYSGFENMPGYQFAIDQGTRAIQRQATAMGSAYTPNTAQAIGQYVTGTAMQDYNTYIQQLQATAGMGVGAATSLAGQTYSTGANIAQLQANTGQSQAGFYTGVGGSLGGALGGYTPGYGYGGGPGASGVGSMVGGFGNIAKGIGTMFGGGTPSAPNAPGNYQDANGNWVDPSNGQPVNTGNFYNDVSGQWTDPSSGAPVDTSIPYSDFGG
jgi:hypothetical protein